MEDVGSFFQFLDFITFGQWPNKILTDEKDKTIASGVPG
jgi:hypothetical protein